MSFVPTTASSTGFSACVLRTEPVRNPTTASSTTIAFDTVRT
jgi:hypothetical protein